MTLFEMLWKCGLVTLSKICLRLRPNAYLSINLRINWIISRIPRWILKILFVLGFYEALAKPNGKIGECPFFKVQSGKLIVWLYSYSLEQEEGLFWSKL